MKCLPIFNTNIAITDYSVLADTLTGKAFDCTSAYAVDFSNTQIVTMRKHDRSFFDLTESIDLFLPDGMPLVWALNWQGAGLRDRVYGPTFTRKFLSSSNPALTHYLVGGSEECGDKFKKVFETMNPRVNFIGSYHGTCSENGILEDDEKVFNELSVLKPHMIWVGLGTPKQYAWIKRAKAAVEKGVFLAVGFAFDVNAGIKRDAPVWMQKRGLTWLFRMFSEPGRLPARYLKWNTLFIYYLMKEKIQRLAPQGSRQKIK